MTILRVGRNAPVECPDWTQVADAFAGFHRAELKVVSLESSSVERIEVAPVGLNKMNIAVERQGDFRVWHGASRQDAEGVIRMRLEGVDLALDSKYWIAPYWEESEFKRNAAAHLVDRMVSRAGVDFEHLENWRAWTVCRSLAIDLAKKWSADREIPRTFANWLYSLMVGRPKGDALRYDLELLIFRELRLVSGQSGTCQR